ncbi:hypothetical protein DPSP01_000525 [Paraphaeosphaeria sporulosa]|uniref:Uncharacterized protein n=1 Tax=Paraphaeosphaeria sporulosa TaxID=1460663 RepID=A0A177C8A5_9PLEO|nr:uncharacterized protein CC84DRAFT_861342 [Paraphaeosphaeria sporulosa]OAG03636.1 hypothetical protein CC84DRAFT_861342 [Paraphaeosphaeria sporulosa]
MATLFSTFPAQQTQGSPHFVPCNGSPKQTPRTLPTKKKALSDDDDIRGNGEEPAHAAHGVKVVDLTCLAETEADY